MLTEHFPKWLATFVTETADELQVPSDAVALLSLGAVSASINGGAISAPTTTWREPVTLYTLALLASGEGKSPIYTRLLDPVHQAFANVTGVSQARDAKYQQIRNRVNRRMVKKVESEALRRVAKGDLTIEEAVAEVAAAERATSLSSSSQTPLRILTDATPAALIDTLQDNDGRIVIATPEAEGLLNFRGASKEVLLKAYDGESFTQSRRGLGEVTIKRPIMTLMIAMQPTVLSKLGADMVNRGVMPRFLISYPDSLIGQRESRPRLVTPEAEADYNEEILRIVRTYSDKDPKTLYWTKGATKEIGLWRDELEPLMAADGILGTIAAWGSKVRGGHFIRLATIMAILRGAETVDVGDCHAAKAILRALMIDAKKAFGDMGASFAEDDLVHLIEKAKRIGPRFTKRDLMRASNRFMANAARCGEALDLAVAQGLIDQKGKEYFYEP